MTVETMENYPLDHAGLGETSLLMAFRLRVSIFGGWQANVGTRATRAILG
jgi:hypothetical protein